MKGQVYGLYLSNGNAELVEWHRVASDNSGIIVVKSVRSKLMWYTSVENLIPLTPLMEALC